MRVVCDLAAVQATQKHDGVVRESSNSLIHRGALCNSFHSTYRSANPLPLLRNISAAARPCAPALISRLSACLPQLLADTARTHVPALRRSPAASAPSARRAI